MLEHKESFNPHIYWEERLRAHPDITGVGFLGLSPQFIELQYFMRKFQVERILRRYGLSDLTEHSVLDVGAGTGIWLNFWHQHGAKQVVGLDFAQPSVDKLKSAFPDDLVVKADLSVTPLPLDDSMRFDIISAFDVLLHIVNPDALERAIANLAHHCTPGGRLIISDPIISAQGYVPKYAYAVHNKVRPISEYQQILMAHGFVIDAILPATIFLSTPLEAANLLEFLAFKACWRITRLWGHSNRLSKLIGPYFAMLDQVACRLCSNGASPSAKMLVARKLN